LWIISVESWQSWQVPPASKIRLTLVSVHWETVNLEPVKVGGFFTIFQYVIELKKSSTGVVENTVNVTVRELSRLGEVLSAVVEAGANNIYGINFSVEDRETAVAEARQLAIEDAQAKAEAIAEEAGISLGDLINISVSSNDMPVTYFDAKGGAYAEAAVPIAAGTLAIVMQANLTYEIQ